MQSQTTVALGGKLRAHGAQILAGSLLALLGFRACFYFDPTSWDALAYHLPYAARVTGLCDATCFRYAGPGFGHLEQFYGSFPLAAEFLQGIFWRVSGRPEATNLVSFGSLILLIAYLSRVWLVPWAWATLALVAVPIVQIFSTISYIDMPTNAAATICCLTIFALLLYPSRVSLGGQLLFVLCAVFLGNSKIQMMPIAAAVALLFLSLVTWSRDAPCSSFAVTTGVGAVCGTLLMLAILATALRNAVVFANPVYPVSIPALGLPGSISASEVPGSIPDYLKSTPQPVRWILSILEVSAFDGKPAPYDIGQAAGVLAPAKSFRMGGYSAFYVISALGFFLLAARRVPQRRLLFIAGAALSICVAFLPGSHELRYYSFWMLDLLAIVLVLYLSPLSSEFPGRAVMAKCVKLVIIASLGGTIAWTAGVFLLEPPYSHESLMTNLGIDTRVKNEIRDGDVVCVSAMQYAMLYTTALNPGRSYTVVSGDDPACNRRY